MKKEIDYDIRPVGGGKFKIVILNLNSVPESYFIINDVSMSTGIAMDRAMKGSRPDCIKAIRFLKHFFKGELKKDIPWQLMSKVRDCLGIKYYYLETYKV